MPSANTVHFNNAPAKMLGIALYVPLIIAPTVRPVLPSFRALSTSFISIPLYFLHFEPSLNPYFFQFEPSLDPYFLHFEPALHALGHVVRHAIGEHGALQQRARQDARHRTVRPAQGGLAHKKQRPPRTLQ